MKENDLRGVVRNLLSVLETFQKYEILDTRLTSTYAEMLTALKLSEKGYDVQVRNERENTNADLYLPEQGTRVEVKTGIGGASFGLGKQIKNGKFDYCVYYPTDDYQLSEPYIFELNDLIEVANPRLHIPRFPKTNPCLLLWCENIHNYYTKMREYKEEKWDIEIDLHKNPEKYRDRWDKIS